MNWNERIEICKKLLKDFEETLPEDREYEKEYALATLTQIEEFTGSEAFLENKDEEKEMDSWKILMSTFDTCTDIIEPIARKLCPLPPTYLTIKEATKELIEDYNKCIEDDDPSTPTMSLSEWLDEKNYILVEEGDERHNYVREKEPEMEKASES